MNKIRIKFGRIQVLFVYDKTRRKGWWKMDASFEKKRKIHVCHLYLLLYLFLDFLDLPSYNRMCMCKIFLFFDFKYQLVVEH